MCMKFWILGDSFGTSNDVTEYYHELKSAYPTIPNRQDIVNSEWVRIIAEHLQYEYNDEYNLSTYGRSADWYLMKLFRLINKKLISSNDFVLITSTAETRFEYSTDISKTYGFDSINSHIKTFQNSTGHQDFTQKEGTMHWEVPSSLQSYMTNNQDYTWLAHLHLMKHEFVKGYLDSLGIKNMIVQGIACRNDDLPDNSLGWGKQPSPEALIKETMGHYGITDDYTFLTYMAFKNHLEPKQNKIYAEQLLEFYKY